MRLVALIVLAACSSNGAPSSHPVSNEAPPAAPDAAVASNTVNGRIIRYEQVGTDQILTINKGSSDGIDRHWRAKLVLDNGASVVEAMLIRVEKTTSMLKAMGPVRVDVPRTTVRFEPPPEEMTEEP
jgi:hypothetical protein